MWEISDMSKIGGPTETSQPSESVTFENGENSEERDRGINWEKMLIHEVWL